MREFTPEEKELIVNTPIDRNCFDVKKEPGWVGGEPTETNMYILDLTEDSFFKFLEALRREYLLTKLDRYFEKLVSLLPNSYKVVRL